MLIVYYELLINAAAFLMYGLDKAKAVRSGYRIPESRLICIAFLGGAFGAWLGMKLFHHKTLKPKFRAVPVFLAIQCVLAGFCLYSNLHLVITPYSYQTDKTDGGYTIVQISDLHNQFFGPGQEYLLKKIRSCEPDIIAVTGDALDGYHTNWYLARRFFEGAAEIAPVYYITGNHELCLDRDKFGEFVNDIEGAGVIFADNSAFDIDGMRLIGLADDSLDDGTLSGLTDGAAFNVLLAHEPAYFDKYAAAGADLVLAGHVHGGQFIIPGKGGLVSPDFKFFPELYAGEHKLGNTTMLISRGLGNSVIPLRLNNYPEIVVVNINKTKE